MSDPVSIVPPASGRYRADPDPPVVVRRTRTGVPAGGAACVPEVSVRVAATVQNVPASTGSPVATYRANPVIGGVAGSSVMVRLSPGIMIRRSIAPPSESVFDRCSTRDCPPVESTMMPPGPGSPGAVPRHRKVRFTRAAAARSECLCSPVDGSAARPLDGARADRFTDCRSMSGRTHAHHCPASPSMDSSTRYRVGAAGSTGHASTIAPCASRTAVWVPPAGPPGGNTVMATVPEAGVPSPRAYVCPIRTPLMLRAPSAGPARP